jgi:hypothetical protein
MLKMLLHAPRGVCCLLEEIALQYLVGSSSHAELVVTHGCSKPSLIMCAPKCSRLYPEPSMTRQY